MALLLDVNDDFLLNRSERLKRSQPAGISEARGKLVTGYQASLTEYSLSRAAVQAATPARSATAAAATR